VLALELRLEMFRKVSFYCSCASWQRTLEGSVLLPASVTERKCLSIKSEFVIQRQTPLTTAGN